MRVPLSRKILPLVTGLAGAGGFGQNPKSPLPRSELREIRAIGCVRKATAGRCVLVVTLDGESTYSFAAAPKPDLGAVVTIEGKPHHGQAVCRQGTEIDITDWEPTGEKCAE